MGGEKDKIEVNIICEDGPSVKGFLHIIPGEKIIDLFNDQKESFIAVTDAEFYNMEEMRSFKLYGKNKEKRNTVILNKSAIKLIEQI